MTTTTHTTTIAKIEPGAMNRLGQGGFSIGLELPLDNDWSSLGRQANAASTRVPGEPDLQRHAQLAKLADRLGFRALWLRDVPLYDPSFGDAAQVFEVFTYLGYLAGITENILLGTAAVVLPLREPVLTLKAAASVDQLSGGRLLLGVASGDRPVEYPVFGRDFGMRGAAFREQVAMLRACRMASACCRVPPRHCRCWWPGWRSSRRPGSASRWTAGSRIRARPTTMRAARRSGAPFPVAASRMSALSTWTWTRTPPCRCSVSASAPARDAMA